MSAFDEIQSALRERADLNARLSLIPYEGTPEIKEVSGRKYLYTRKRVGSRVTSTYVGTYSDELYQLLLRNTREAREIRKSLRKLDRTLAELGYQEIELAPRVIQNLDFARANMKANIYDQAVLEGVATSFPQTEEIIENGKVNGMIRYESSNPGIAKVNSKTGEITGVKKGKCYVYVYAQNGVCEKVTVNVR